MLERALQALASGELLTLEDLARQMNISMPLMEQVLQDLERGGYIRAVEAGCEQSCPGCPQSGICALAQGKRIWAVTEKGFRLAARA